MKYVLTSYWSLIFILFACNNTSSINPGTKQAPTNDIAETDAQTSKSTEDENCVGDINCITEVRKLVNGAGWEIANEEYAGEGTFYISAFQYGPGEPISMTYVMDCDCKPSDFNLHNRRSNQSSENLHRCGRRWDGHSQYLNGQWGDYCSIECYADLYPN